MIDILKANISLSANSPFNGRVATIIPVEANGVDAWVQQFNAAYKLWKTIGNDQMTLGLWYSRIPTLFEYNQFSSPVFHALVKRTLQQPALPHERNISILSHANARVLKLLGVRYAILPQDVSPLGPRRAVQNVDGQQWGLFELPDVNLATYSPTSIEVRGRPRRRRLISWRTMVSTSRNLRWCARRSAAPSCRSNPLRLQCRAETSTWWPAAPAARFLSCRWSSVIALKWLTGTPDRAARRRRLLGSMAS